MPDIGKNKIEALLWRRMLGIVKSIVPDDRDLAGDRFRKKRTDLPGEKRRCVLRALHHRDGAHLLLSCGHKRKITETETVGEDLSRRLCDRRQGGDGFVRQQRHPFPAVFKNGGVIIRLGKKADLGDHSLILGDKKISADEGFPGSEPLHTKLPFSASFPIADRGGKQSVKGIPRKIRRRQAVEGFLKIISEKILIPFPFPAHRIKTAKGGNILGISIFHWHVAAFGDLPNAVPLPAMSGVRFRYALISAVISAFMHRVSFSPSFRLGSICRMAVTSFSGFPYAGHCSRFPQKSQGQDRCSEKPFFSFPASVKITEKFPSSVYFCRILCYNIN